MRDAHWVSAAVKVLDMAVGEYQRTHWLPVFGGTAGAYLLFFYAGVFLELQKPSPMIVFIG